jgi:hypothetical protein
VGKGTVAKKDGRLPKETQDRQVKYLMRMSRRRHCILIEPGVTGEVRFVNKLFDLAAQSALQRAVDSIRPPLIQQSRLSLRAGLMESTRLYLNETMR